MGRPMESVEIKLKKKKRAQLTFHCFIAGALQELAGTAGLRHGVGHARRHDGIDERRFAGIYASINIEKSLIDYTPPGQEYNDLEIE